MKRSEIIDLEEENKKRVRAYLVGGNFIGTKIPFGSDPLYELKGLVDTLEIDVVNSTVLLDIEPSAKFGIGSGKAQEIVDHAKADNVDCIIFDFEISPTHQRNWENLTGFPVFDRNEVILRIFASRARTKEAVLQVELARLAYSLPRLAHSYGDMARQRGGSYGSKGSGETKLELDKRTIKDRVKQLKKELTVVVKERETLRKKRDKIPLPSCALVGYTNAGKSSLLNALTGADVFVEDKLFATLDPTTRRFSLPGSNGILMTDTVGFINNLPHNLVDAFKSTLEEAARADLLLVVLDATDPMVENQYETVIKVITEIGAESIPRIILLNKADIVKDEVLFARLKFLFPEAIVTSAKNKLGFTEIADLVCKKLLGDEKCYLLPLDKQDLIKEVRQNGLIINSEWRDDSILLKARVSGKIKNLLEPYLQCN